jgi:predicted dehydrogenase
MTQEITQIGVIGVGQIGKVHLDAYVSMPNAKVTAIAGRDPQKTEEVANHYGIPFWTTDYHALLDKKDIQAVSVCLHNNLHMPVALAALHSGKHVICEKPIAGSYCDGLKMVETAKKENKQLSVQISDLFSRETKAARMAIENGWLGDPYLAHSSGFRRKGRPYVDGYGTTAFVQKASASGGALLDMGIYHIANILYLLGNPLPTRISGRTFQRTSMNAARRAVSQFDVEEVAVGLITLENDVALTITEAWAMHLDHLEGSYITGTDGGIRLNPFGLFRSLAELDLNATTDLEALDFRLHHVLDQGTAYDSPLHHFIAAAQGRVPLIPTSVIALNTMLISEGIYLSQQLSREVTVQEVVASSVSTAQVV